jgi:hypothetical protein
LPFAFHCAPMSEFPWLTDDGQRMFRVCANGVVPILPAPSAGRG